MRIELFYRKNHHDGRSPRLAASLTEAVSAPVSSVDIVDVYLISGVPSFTADDALEVFADPVAQRILVDRPAAGEKELSGFRYLVEVAYRAGVTDPEAITAREAIRIAREGEVPDEAVVRTARQYLIHAGELSPIEETRLRRALYNPLIQREVFIPRAEWNAGVRPPGTYPHAVAPSPISVESIELDGLDDEGLLALSRRRLLALSLPEMRAVREYLLDPAVKEERRATGLPPEATDVELEMIAQTWSEHCKHKIFQARIEYREDGRSERIDSLFAEYIKRTTEELSSEKTFLRSVFHDNSGVVKFDEENLLCFKVETHNSPSALDPYGGAITGIVGVNRDIMGTGKGAKPIFNTNVLCFGEPDALESEIPEGLMHPRRVMSGVHEGIVDGGNQSGIPVVAGAFLFDESFTGKPLVFCGTGGLLPAKIGGEDAWIKHIRAGDLAVMVGGRIGKDGIHGATFSSLALDETSPTSAVQIGDPITQKKMLDFLLEARDALLYDGITDNGAGGLSSSLGEMAQDSGGVRIELSACPLKYQGLAPWEILVSESQERMSLSVPKEKIEAFLSLAGRRDVEATVIGEFTDSGAVEILYEGRPVGLLSLEFLHGGLPAMNLIAEWKAPVRTERPAPAPGDGRWDGVLLALLREPNIASKEPLVRRYDHEVQAQSVVKPFSGPACDGPSDGAVLRPVYDSVRGVTVTHGICPRYSEIDTYHMAMCAVDEAYRAHIACGGDPDEASALDNFCWPDPVLSADTPDGAYKLAQLVRACRGLKEACIAYGLPLISGKDSMKNDTRIGGKKVSVKPTLLVSLMGVIRDIRKAMTVEFKRAGDAVYLLGGTRRELAGSFYEKITGSVYTEVPTVRPETALRLYRALNTAIEKGLIASCHDISDGGAATALAECALGGRLGAEVDFDRIPGDEEGRMESEALLFSETPSRFVISVPQESTGEFERIIEGLPARRIGRVSAEGMLRIRRGGTLLVESGIDALLRAFKREGASW